ncbi:MAG: DEAD/DEAH box helicase [Nitriliruptoraceae bacterium]
MSDPLLAAVRDALADGEPRSTDELLRAVRAAGGRGVGRAALGRALAAAGDVTEVEVLGRRRWQLAGGDLEERVELSGAGADAPMRAAGTLLDVGATRAALDALELRTWQAEALAAWSTTCRGVVEAVTGTGKTRLAIAAVRTVLDAGGRVLVLVPTLELVDQWHAGLRALVPAARVGRLGGGGQDDLYAHDVVLATPHSAADVPIEAPPGLPGLLVADEAHRYGAPTWGRALKEELPLRLALTATYERGDDGVAEVLEPYFGEVVFRYRYDRAVADGTVAPFAIAHVGVELSDAERTVHDAADARVRTLHGELVGPLGMPKEPGALLRAVTAVVADADRRGGGQGGGPGSGQGRQVVACREYLARIRQRRDVAATAAAKLEVVRAAAPALAGGRSLVFTDTIAQADDAARALVAAGVGAETVHGQLSDDRRRIRLAQFRRGRITCLVAPRVLDEGIDVPDADVALVLAAFRTRRQLIQRLGRVLRVKDDGRAARLVLVHARGTGEDPARGGHADFLAEVAGVAERVDHLDPRLDPSAIARWLASEQRAPGALR